ncbi:MAG: hypothetical protein KF744_00415 [Taibaiella sp.]|nr:hypothetical protein [Taibaiella sp.]
MELEQKYNEIVNRLRQGMKFGLFENGMRCYFQDGTHISYNDLWKAIRIHQGTEGVEKRSLSQLCPDTFVGTHAHKYSRHNWKKTSTETSK